MNESMKFSPEVRERAVHMVQEHRSEYANALAMLEWVSWFNHRRPLEPIGCIPPAEADEEYYRQLTSQAAIPV